MRKQLRTYVLGFLFDFKPKSVIIRTLLSFLVYMCIRRTLFYIPVNMDNVCGILVVCLILIVYIIGARLLE